MRAGMKGITADGWVCACCNTPLEPMLTNITYMGSSFPIELPGCKECQTIFIPPDVALGKMLEVEQILEDK